MISTYEDTTISTKNGLHLNNTKNDNYSQEIELSDSSIKLHVKNPDRQTTFNIETDAITLPKGITASIYGGDNNKRNFIKYNPPYLDNPASLHISSDDLQLGNNQTGTITTNAKKITVDSNTEFKQEFTAEGKFNVTSGNITIGNNKSTVTLNADKTYFNTGNTTFTGNLGVIGNVTATNVTVNGLLVTETSSVTSVLTYEDGSNWDYEYGPEYDNKGEYVQKMFLFGLTTIDLNYVFDPKFVPESMNSIYNTDFITVTNHSVNGYKVNGSDSVKPNTRNFFVKPGDNGMEVDDYVYSDINLNLTAFLNAHSEDSMFARGKLTRNNGKVLVTNIDDVNIKLANPTLYNIDALITKKDVGDGQKSYVNIPTEHRLKTFLLFIERFAYFANPTDDFSIKDVYALRQAKEISMTMDNFNPDMINHICVLTQLTPTEESEE